MPPERLIFFLRTLAWAEFCFPISSSFLSPSSSDGRCRLILARIYSDEAFPGGPGGAQWLGLAWGPAGLAWVGLGWLGLAWVGLAWLGLGPGRLGLAWLGAQQAWLGILRASRESLVRKMFLSALRAKF